MMPPFSLPDFLSSSYWFDPNPGFPTPYYAILAVLLVVGSAASLYLAYFHVRRQYADHTFKARVFGRFGQGFAAIFIVGLVLAGLRYVQISYLSTRFLLYLDLLAALGLVAFAAFYFTRRFPSRLADYDAEALRRRYFPRPGSGKGRRKRKSK